MQIIKKKGDKKMDEGHQYMIMALMIGAAISFSVAMDRKNDKELQETTTIAYEKCKRIAPTKTYQADGTNYVMFGNEQYKVTNEKYGFFIENKLCK